MPEKRYTIPLSDVDQMIVRQDRAGHIIQEFSVQLEILINGRWRVAMRFDSAHNRPHRHIFYPNGVKYREFMAADDNNEAFTQAQAILKKSFREIHERYKIVLERM
ncbi:MAG: hypothetical protein AAB834_03470 [Patescibacteria group bacterium]